MIKVKVCGITNSDDALKASEYGADALGFVFYKGSPRYITPDEARSIVQKLPPFITTVGVFVNESSEVIHEITGYAAIDIVQLHGDETPDACRMDKRVIKAIRVRELSDLEMLRHYNVSAFLLDAYSPESFGGTGRTFNWDIALDAKQFFRVILAGGLNPDNIKDAVRHVRPYGVDVSSGVEKEKRKKDHARMRLFIERAKGA